MSTDETDRQEGTDPDWETVGRSLLALELRVRAGDISQTLNRIAQAADDGDDVDPGDLSEARQHLDMTIQLLEESLGPTGGACIHTEYDTDFEPCSCGESN